MTGYRLSPKGALFWGYMLILLLAIMMCSSSCGVRRSNSDKESSKAVDESKESSKGNTSKESSSSEEQSSKDKTDKQDEKQESRVRELFYENGMLKERITELINSKSSDNSTKEQNSRKTLYSRVDSVFTTTIIKKITLTERKKTKDVESDKTVVANLGGQWSLLAGIIIVVCAILLYFYIKRRK